MRRAPLPNVRFKTFLFALALMFINVGTMMAQTCTTPITTFPYVESFNSTSSLPNCWTTSAGSGAFYQWAPTAADPNYGPAGPEAGAGFVYLYVYLASASYNTYNLTSPYISLPSVPKQLKYYYFLGSFGYTGTSGSSGSDPYPLAVQVSIDSGVTWTDIYDHSSSNSTFASTNSISNWHSNTVDLTAYANQTILIRYVGNSNYNYSICDQGIDEFSISDIPACSGIPSTLSVSSVTGTGAIAYWTDASPAPASGYNWVVVASGAGPTGTPVASGTSLVGDDSTVISGVTTSTTYDFYIQSNCGGATGVGSWAGSISFTTPCGNINLPVIQGFNSTSSPNCWTQQFVTGTSPLQFVASSFSPATTPQEGTDYVFWNSYSIYNGETRLVSPPITTTGSPSVDISFYWYNENSQYYSSGNYLNEGVTVQYSPDGITWTPVQFYPRQDASYAVGSGGWKKKSLTLPLAVANQSTVYIGFSFYAADGDNCSFDNLNISQSPPCAGGPSAIGAYNITSNSATISWTDAPIIPANGYNWVIVAAGDSANSPTPIATGSTLTGVDSALISGLTPNTPYDIYVQSNCGGVAGLGLWEGPGSFSTPCVAITSIPWTEGFEGLGTNVGNNLLPPCWLGTPSGRWTSADAPLGFPPNITSHTGTNYVYGRYNAHDTIFTPGFALTGGVTYEFYYYYQTDGYQGWDSIKTMYGNSQNAAGMTTALGNTIYSATNQGYVKFTSQFTPATSGTYYFGVNISSTYSPDDIAFDDFGLKLAPACAGIVSNEAASNLTPTSGIVSWNAATPAPSNGYNWELVATGDSVNGTVLFSGSTAAGIDSVALSGLSPYTSYDLYVQTNCGLVLGVGDWTGPLTFRTPCTAITSLPWHDGFESIGSNTGRDLLPPCWLPTPSQRWYTSSTAFSFPTLGPRAGTNFLYNRYNANDTVFTPGFSLTGGTQYEFYFYYQTDGNSGWDSIYAMYGNYQSQSAMTTQIGPVVLGPTNTSYMKYSAIFTPTTSGTYYFGVKLSASFNPYEMAFDDFGLQEVVPCPNPPITGTISGPTSICSGNNANLTLTGYSPYTVLQWQTSSDSINFSDIVGANQDFLTTNVSTVSYFRVKVLCADSAYTAVFPIYMNAPTLCYCATSLGGGCGGNNIDTAAILATNFFVNYTSCNTLPDGSAYTQFPPIGDSTTGLQRGSTYQIYMHFTGSTISSAWIDFDQSGSFDPTEWVQVSTSGNSGLVSITVPLNAALGATGLRLRSRAQFNTNGAPNACTQFGSGETFDFIINIVDSNCYHIPTVIDTVTNVSCHGLNNGSLALGISGPDGPYTNLWSTGDTNTAIHNLAAGVYVDTIRFDYGCTYLWHMDSVAQPAILAASTDSIHAVKCFGASTGAIFVSATGGTAGYTSHWSSGDVTFSLSGKPTGTYTDTITDSHGCVVVLAPDSISQPASAVSVTIDSTHSVKCHGQSNGAIFASGHGGTSGYTFTWSTSGSTTGTLSNLAAGGYAVSVSDANGCTVSAVDTVTQPGVLTIVTDSVTNAKCHSSSDGSIYVHVTGGTLNYHYAWTGGSTTFNLFLKPAGTYTLTVTDANSCTATATDTITSPSAVTVTSSITNQINNGALGAISTTVSGGSSPYKYRWSTGDSTSSLSNLTAGVYTVTVTDKNGCTAFQRDTVNLIINSITEVNGDVKNFNVYPNPSAGQFNVLVDLSNAVPVQIEVYNITGQLLPNVARQGALNNIYQLDLSDQAGGVYLIKLIAGDYTLVRKVTLVK